MLVNVIFYSQHNRNTWDSVDLDKLRDILDGNRIGICLDMDK